MWPSDRLTGRLGIEHPIVLAPMASATNARIAAAVSNAGGLGSYGAAGTPPARLREVVREIRTLTDRPFNVNLFTAVADDWDRAARLGPRFEALLRTYHEELQLGELPAPEPMFGPFEAQLEVLVEERVPIVSFHFGAPADAVERARRAGATVMSSATTVAEARALEAAGVDVVIAQGAEAGGHRGTFEGRWEQALIGVMALVPQVCDAVSVPVLAAGGIMDARGIAAALALGADGVQMGTAFLACEETPIPAIYRRSLLEAADDATAVTTVLSGRAARGLASRYVEEGGPLADEALPYPAQYSVTRTLRAAAVERDVADFVPMWAGQGVGLLAPGAAGERLTALARETRERLAALAGAGRC